MSAVQAAERQPIQRTDQFQSVAARGTQVHVAGGTGVYLRSSDGGASWQRTVLPGKPPLIDIAICPDGAIALLDFRSRVWMARGDAPPAQPSATGMDGIAMDLTCAPDGRLWVVGEYAQILSSGDGGTTWQTHATDNEDLILTAVEFVTPTVGFAAGEFGTFLATEDAGASWQVRGPVAADFYPQASHFDSPTSGFLTSLSGQIYATRDGGRSWQREPTATRAAIYRIARVGDRLIAVGNLGTLLRRDDDGWQSLRPTPSIYTYLRGLAALDADHFLAAGGDGTLRRLSLTELAGPPGPAAASGTER